MTACVANSSNPTVSVASATTDGSSVAVRLELSNPGGRRLGIEAIEYELSHGEIGFPVATGTWAGDVDLPAGGTTGVDLVVAFEVMPFEADSRLFHLNGQLRHKDHTGFLGLPSMDLGETAFHLDFEATQGDIP